MTRDHKADEREKLPHPPTPRRAPVTFAGFSAILLSSEWCFLTCLTKFLLESMQTSKS